MGQEGTEHNTPKASLSLLRGPPRQLGKQTCTAEVQQLWGSPVQPWEFVALQGRDLHLQGLGVRDVKGWAGDHGTGGAGAELRMELFSSAERG